MTSMTILGNVINRLTTKCMDWVENPVVKTKGFGGEIKKKNNNKTKPY